MSRKRSLKEHIEDAAIARCDLNIFYAVIAILEGGTISAHSHRHAQRIIFECKSASQQCLERMDKSIEAALSSRPSATRVEG